MLATVALQTLEQHYSHSSTAKIRYEQVTQAGAGHTRLIHSSTLSLLARTPDDSQRTINHSVIA